MGRKRSQRSCIFDWKQANLTRWTHGWWKRESMRITRGLPTMLIHVMIYFVALRKCVLWFELVSHLSDVAHVPFVVHSVNEMHYTYSIIRILIIKSKQSMSLNTRCFFRKKSLHLVFTQPFSSLMHKIQNHCSSYNIGNDYPYTITTVKKNILKLSISSHGLYETTSPS